VAESKVALVTGVGNHRVGWFVADALAARGFALVLPYRRAGSPAATAADEFRTRGHPAMSLQADLTSDADVRQLVSDTLAQFGRLDVLVTCAGAWEAGRLEDLTAADVVRHFEANVLSTFLIAQHAGLAMTRQPAGGCIVTIGDWAIARPYPNHAAYFATKGAIPTLTRCLAVELGTRNPAVRVNCVEPGPILPPSDRPPGEWEQAAARGTLVGRPGRPENIAAAVLFFMDNDFVTGTYLPVDGGRTVFAPDPA
jgi:pteridine reductase